MRTRPRPPRHAAATAAATLALVLGPSAAWASTDDDHAVHGGHDTQAPASAAGPDEWGHATHEHGTTEMDDSAPSHAEDEMADHERAETDHGTPSHDEHDITDDETAETETDAPGHDDHGETAAAPSRPRGAVLCTFAGVNGAVLVAAGLLRRRDRARPRHRPRRPTPAV